MTHPRGLSVEEADAWEKLAATVSPLHPLRPVQPRPPHSAKPPAAPRPRERAFKPPSARPVTVRTPVSPTPGAGLDSHWDRRLKSGTLQPELTLDLHGHNLDAAYEQVVAGVGRARAMGARTILLVTGKLRPVEAADRGSRRGAIRAKVLDWLAASSHHTAIAAVRRAHQRHGGDGALYIVLKRER